MFSEEFMLIKGLAGVLEALPPGMSVRVHVAAAPGVSFACDCDGVDQIGAVLRQFHFTEPGMVVNVTAIRFRDALASTLDYIDGLGTSIRRL